MAGNEPFDELNDITPWFWSVIDKAGQEKSRLAQILQAMPAEDIARFHWQFEWAITEMSGEAFREVYGYSEDQMQDLAAWIVSQGKDTYANIYNNPQLLPKIDDLEESRTVAGVASDVYRSLFKKDIPQP